MTSYHVALAVSILCGIICFMVALVTDKAVMPLMLYWVGITLGLFSGISLEKTFRQERSNHY